jgi:hypothetical protein
VLLTALVGLLTEPTEESVLVDVFTSDTSSFFILLLAIVGVTILSVRGLPLPDAGELLAQLGRNAMVAALLGALGVGLGALLRNQVVAITGVLVLSLVVEPVVLGLAPDVGRFSPFGPLPAAASGLSADEALGLGGVDLIAPGLAVLAMLAWIGAAFAAGAALLRGRDLH